MRSCCAVQAQRASLQKKLEERQADLEAKKAALAAVRAGTYHGGAGLLQGAVVLVRCVLTHMGLQGRAGCIAISCVLAHTCRAS